MEPMSAWASWRQLGMGMPLTSDLASVGAALGRIPSGCSILTVSHSGRATGMLVSWVQQASFSPPAVTVCLRRGRPATAWIEASRHFLLNVIGQDTTAMFKHFGKGFSLDEDAFEGLATQPTEFGPLIPTCLAHLGCRILGRWPIGDHDLFAAEVVWGSLSGEGAPYTHLRKNGLNY